VTTKKKTAAPPREKAVKGEKTETTKTIDPGRVIVTREIHRDGIGRRVDLELVEYSDGDRVVRLSGNGSGRITATVVVPVGAVEKLREKLAEAREITGGHT
jgi:hypothetical protein